jgi:hypothetical protein
MSAERGVVIPQVSKFQKIIQAAHVTNQPDKFSRLNRYSEHRESSSRPAQFRHQRPLEKTRYMFDVVRSQT